MLEDLSNNSAISDNMKFYLISLTARVKSMIKKLKTTSNLLITAGHSFESSVEQAISSHSDRMNGVM